ncbi:hypothetical protein [Flavobacterium sp.]|uniref:hypothetical protein n=1 Tax=Flavobacterium sp. TaxID=239 RepID=UPI004048AD42
MASSSEVGHAKNISNLETMISYCTGYGAAYNPSNPELTLQALATLHTESKAALKLVKTTERPFKDVEGQRKLLFKNLKPLATKVMGAIRSSGAPETVVENAETINRKIQGRRANTKEEPTPEGEKPKNKISVSQQSFDLQIDHLDKLIELTTVEPKYNPNETPLQVATLNNYKTALENINTIVKNAYTPYSNAMIARNKKLYDPEIGLVDRTQLVKNYVKSLYGASSSEYKQINKLRFKNIE